MNNYRWNKADLDSRVSRQIKKSETSDLPMTGNLDDVIVSR